MIMSITNPREDEKQGCRSFTLKCKHELLMKIESSHAFSSSLKETCWQCGIQSWYYCQWKKQLDTVPDSTSSNVRKIHSGHPGSLAPLENLLLRNVFALLEQGMVVMTWIVLRRASDLCQIFCAKSDGTKSLIVHRWLKAQGSRYLMGNNESQCSPAEAASDALNFMQKIKKKVSETDCEKNVLSIWIKPLSSSPVTPNKLWRWEV